MTYSIDFRRQVLSVREKEGLTIAVVSKRFGIGMATVVRWLNRLEPRRARHKPATKIDRIALARDVREYPDAYQSERVKRLGANEKGIGHALRRMNVGYKKTLRHPRADAAARRAFVQGVELYQAETRPIVYSDESGFAHVMPRRHGYSACRQRCCGLCDWQAKGRTNAIGALIGKALPALGLFNANINADIFYQWTTQSLPPPLPALWWWTV